MNINEKLRYRRKELNFTMLDVAKKVGVSEATVSRWESGHITSLKGEKIILLAQALDVPVSYIMNTDPPSTGAGEGVVVEDNMIIIGRNGDVIKKKLTAQDISILSRMIEALPEDDNPDL